MIPEGNKSKIEYSRALEDFRRARSKARLQHLWAAITGESLDLLRFDEITLKMHGLGLSSKGLHDIPIDAIVGSVNRYQDFDRNFLPLHDSDVERWANVKAVMTTPGSMGLPPIRVYKIGEVYFVLDGNHRVSIARQMGIDHVEAYVTEIKTRVPISQDDSPDEIILKAEYSDFLENTGINKILPDAEFLVTFPGQYLILEEHINVHRHFMGLEQQREIPWEEAVRHWYENVYQPVVEIIREQNFLMEFPKRTETDLYIWVLDHQSYLQEQLGWSIRPEKAASDLLRQNSRRFFRVIQRWFQKLHNAVFTGRAKSDFSSDEQRSDTGSIQQNLFADILVAISGKPDSWIALEQAVRIAEMEGSDVRGLVIKKGYEWVDQSNSDEDLQQAFSDRLERSGIRGNLVFAQGKIAETICERAKVNDLVTLKLKHPPSTNILARLKSGTRKIVRNSTRPLLFVRDELSEMNHILLAYDGSPKGMAALYIAAYLASRYNKHLSVLVVDDDEARGRQKLSEAKEYLGVHCVRRVYRKPNKRISIVIPQAAEEINADLIIMGGYGLSPLLEMIFGSTVDGVLRGTRVPVIVAQ
jgi:nucleotide-binding universal stress UspA family protein